MQDFWDNVARYPRYLISITLGVVLSAFQPLMSMFQRPSTAIATTGFLLAALAFIALTLRAMLGLNAV